VAISLFLSTFSCTKSLDDFDESQLLTNSSISSGKKLYEWLGCASCHSVDASEAAGGTLKAILGTKVIFEDGTSRLRDREYLRESILNPSRNIVRGRSDFMKNYSEIFRDHEDKLKLVLDYLESLK
jgi:cytochrome c oxidase subunit 2